MLKWICVYNLDYKKKRYIYARDLLLNVFKLHGMVELICIHDSVE